VVELFTSEGCSSCPPADKLLRRLAAENKDVYVLSYHVDYWDYLGWKDPFSQVQFSSRQRQYAQQFGLKSVYTPQVVVNGAEEFVGSDEVRLRSVLQKSSVLPGIDVKVERKDEATVAVTYSLPTGGPHLLQVALVQPQAVTTVKRGENKGKTLEHVNVVRRLKTVPVIEGNGTIMLTVHSSLKETPLEVIVFTQQKANSKITAAIRTAVPKIQGQEGLAINR
jgi:hypothetical protein